MASIGGFSKLFHRDRAGQTTDAARPAPSDINPPEDADRIDIEREKYRIIDILNPNVRKPEDVSERLDKVNKEFDTWESSEDPRLAATARYRNNSAITAESLLDGATAFLAVPGRANVQSETGWNKKTKGAAVVLKAGAALPFPGASALAKAISIVLSEYTKIYRFDDINKALTKAIKPEERVPFRESFSLALALTRMGTLGDDEYALSQPRDNKGKKTLKKDPERRIQEIHEEEEESAGKDTSKAILALVFGKVFQNWKNMKPIKIISKLHETPTEEKVEMALASLFGEQGLVFNKRVVACRPPMIERMTNQEARMTHRENVEDARLRVERRKKRVDDYKREYERLQQKYGDEYHRTKKALKDFQDKEDELIDAQDQYERLLPPPTESIQSTRSSGYPSPASSVYHMGNIDNAFGAQPPAPPANQPHVIMSPALQRAREIHRNQIPYRGAPGAPPVQAGPSNQVPQMNTGRPPGESHWKAAPAPAFRENLGYNAESDEESRPGPSTRRRNRRDEVQAGPSGSTPAPSTKPRDGSPGEAYRQRYQQIQNEANEKKNEAALKNLFRGDKSAAAVEALRKRFQYIDYEAERKVDEAAHEALRQRLERTGHTRRTSEVGRDAYEWHTLEKTRAETPSLVELVRPKALHLSDLSKEEIERLPKAERREAQQLIQELEAERRLIQDEANKPAELFSRERIEQVVQNREAEREALTKRLQDAANRKR